MNIKINNNNILMEQKDPLSIQQDVNLEEDILKKQQLLQAEILDKDLDKDQF